MSNNVITRLEIKNYLGIEHCSTDVPPGGVQVKGSNGRGKTSVLRAITAALAGQGIKESDIRLGADKAEILVDLTSVSVRRVITKNASTVTVTNADGFRAPKPQAFLNDLLGNAGIDPIDIFLDKPRDRRERVQAAMPLRVSLEQLKTWVPKLTVLPPGVSLEEHGLDVIAKVRKLFYDERTVKNAAAKEARRVADEVRGQAKEAADALGAGADVDVATAKATLVAAEQATQALGFAKKTADESQARTASARDRIAALREKADKALEQSAARMPPPETLKLAEEALSDAETHVRDLREAMAKAEAVQATAERESQALSDMVSQAGALAEQAATATAQASDLEATVTAATAPPVDPAQFEAAHEALAKAQVAMQRAVKAEALALLRARASQLSDAADVAEDVAGDLDAVVKRLTNDAPAELIAGDGGIPGITIDGDDVLLDGVRLETLSGAEQMRFAVEIAKRINRKSKILICDGIERIAADRLDEFLGYVTANGWQAICSRVTEGALVLEAIETTATDQAAE